MAQVLFFVIYYLTNSDKGLIQISSWSSCFLHPPMDFLLR